MCEVCVSRHKKIILLLYTIVRVIASIVLAVILLTASNNMAMSINIYMYFAIVTKTIESGCLAHQSPETTWHDSVSATDTGW